MNIRATSINCGVTADKKRFPKYDVHVPSESDPNFPGNHGGSVSQGSRSRSQRIVTRIGNSVVDNISTNIVGHLAGETNRTSGE